MNAVSERSQLNTSRNRQRSKQCIFHTTINTGAYLVSVVGYVFLRMISSEHSWGGNGTVKVQLLKLQKVQVLRKAITRVSVICYFTHAFMLEE